MDATQSRMIVEISCGLFASNVANDVPTVSLFLNAFEIYGKVDLEAINLLLTNKKRKAAKQD